MRAEYTLNGNQVTFTPTTMVDRTYVRKWLVALTACGYLQSTDVSGRAVCFALDDNKVQAQFFINDETGREEIVAVIDAVNEHIVEEIRHTKRLVQLLRAIFRFDEHLLAEVRGEEDNG